MAIADILRPPRRPAVPKAPPTPPKELSVQELVAEAQADQPLLKKIGWRDSAVLHPQVMKRQYTRAAQYFGFLGIGPYFLGGLALVLACLGSALAFHLGWTNIIPNQHRMADLPEWLGLAVGFGVGIPIGLAGLGSILSTLRWALTYSDGLVIHRDQDWQPGASKTLLLEAFQRVVFADRQIGLFRGGEGEGGFAKARRMGMRTEKDIPSSTSPKDFYDSKPSSSDYVGNHAAIIKALVLDAVEAGKAGREFNQPVKKKGLGLDPVGNGGLLLGVIMILLAAGIQCVGVDTSALAGSVVEQLPYTE